MARLASRLEASTGLRAVSIAYPSRKLSIADAAAVVSARAAEACGGAGRPAFAVTFSLGGPIIRHATLLGESSSSDGKRSSSSVSGGGGGGGGPRWLGSVLLAPPNRGSDLARELLHAPSTPGIVRRLFRFVYGPAVLDLASPPEVIDREWPDAPRPCGVIAGTAPRSLNPASLLLASRVFGGVKKGKKSDRGGGEGPGGAPPRRPSPRAHDGTVAVDETRLPTPADDFATVHAGHTLIAESKETAALVAAFLTRGRFSSEAEAEAEENKKMQTL